MYLSMCEVEVYQEHFPTLDDVEKICKEHDTIKKYVIALHEYDRKANGDLKKAHYHVYLHFGVGRSQDTKIVENWFNVAGNYIERIKGKWDDVVLYAVHANAPEKYQYTSDVVRSSFDFDDELVKAKERKRQKEAGKNLANEVMRGEKTLRQAQKELLLYNYSPTASRYLRDAYNIYARNVSPQRNVTVFLLHGASASGKTALAQELCKVDGMDYCLSGSGSDPLSDYMGEKALILDDVREDTFTFTEWLKLLDPYTGSPIRSRYSNKIFTGDTIYMTTSQNPLFWFVGTNEERWQFFRRIKLYIVCTTETVFHYDGFVRQGNYIDLPPVTMEYKNPIPIKYPQEHTQDQYASKLCQSMNKIFETLTSNMQEITDMKEIEKK